jgi:hypothetical protein
MPLDAHLHDACDPGRVPFRLRHADDGDSLIASSIDNIGKTKTKARRQAFILSSRRV